MLAPHENQIDTCQNGLYMMLLPLLVTTHAATVYAVNLQLIVHVNQIAQNAVKQKCAEQYVLPAVRLTLQRKPISCLRHETWSYITLVK